jgi:hypothetical protein
VFNEYSSGGFITKEHVGKILNEKDDDKARAAPSGPSARSSRVARAPQPRGRQRGRSGRGVRRSNPFRASHGHPAMGIRRQRWPSEARAWARMVHVGACAVAVRCERVDACNLQLGVRS